VSQLSAAYLSAVLANRRRELGISQTELARRVGCPQSYISELETGNLTPSIIRLFRLCESLYLSPTSVVANLYGEWALQRGSASESPHIPIKGGSAESVPDVNRTTILGTDVGDGSNLKEPS
jgi:transcriptional regulator with XRE-family HTH domain